MVFNIVQPWPRIKKLFLSFFSFVFSDSNFLQTSNLKISLLFLHFDRLSKANPSRVVCFELSFNLFLFDRYTLNMHDFEIELVLSSLFYLIIQVCIGSLDLLLLLIWFGTSYRHSCIWDWFWVFVVVIEREVENENDLID